MTRMTTTDPRIGAILEADPLLRFVGDATITDVLKAADAAGIIPAADTAEVRAGLRGLSTSQAPETAVA